ncbi:hypothetical protein [Candidatus Poriferisodalis sp.]|uniref:hypothetical protein n=1 Tax=Candidatus Poriferisodalis sp. TaxID=3101277 RepID=UPI003B01CC76
MAILFGGVLFTILIGVHVVLVSLARTAAQSAADRGVAAAQSAPLGPSTCGTLGGSLTGGAVTPASERECQGVVAAWTAMNATAGMVRQLRPPAVTVDDDVGVVSVVAFGVIQSPVIGPIRVAGAACGPLERVEGDEPSRGDVSAC